MSSIVADKLAGDVSSFDRVYRKHVRDVYRFSSALLGNAHDAEDATQTTFLQAYRALERGERVRNVRGWLLGIARNVCRQHFRTTASRVQVVELNGDEPAAPANGDGPSASDIREALSHLPFNQRLALVLREIEGRRYDEIAEAMGLSLPAVETLLFRARQALREQLEAAEHAVGCDGFQRLISLQLDGRLQGEERALLRAHLRACDDCARLARRERSRKRLMPGLAAPLPLALQGGFSVGGGVVATKAAAVAVAAALAGTGLVVLPRVLPDDPAPRTSADAVEPLRAGSPKLATLGARTLAPATAWPTFQLGLARSGTGDRARSAPVDGAAKANATGGNAAVATPGVLPGAANPDAGSPSTGEALPGSPAHEEPTVAPPSAPPAASSSPPPAVASPPPAVASPPSAAPPPPPPPAPSPSKGNGNGPPAGVPVGPPTTPVGPPVTPPRGGEGSRPVGPPTTPVGPPVTPPRGRP